MVTVGPEQISMLKTRLDLLRRKMQRHLAKHEELFNFKDPDGLQLLMEISGDRNIRTPKPAKSSRLFFLAGKPELDGETLFNNFRNVIKEHVNKVNEGSDKQRAVAILSIKSLVTDEQIVYNDQFYNECLEFNVSCNDDEFEVILGTKIVKGGVKTITQSQYRALEEDLEVMAAVVTRMERIRSCTLINDIRFTLSLSDEELSVIARNNSKFENKKRGNNER